MNKLLQFQAHLITGSEHSIHTYLIEQFASYFCSSQGCKNCAVCTAISEKHFHSISWIAPETRYTLETIAPIMSRIEISMHTDQHHFFVITQAQLLTPACANMLLKVVEEPPTGFHFIFIAPHKHLVLPTIMSRCVQTQYNDSSITIISHPLINEALKTDPNYEHVHTEIARYTLSEIETHILFQELLVELSTLYKKNIASDQPYAFLEALQEYVKEILDNPISPGSGKILWRNFFMYKALQSSKH